MELNYDLLLKLNRGAGTVVERLTSDEREALLIETPIIRFLRALPNQDEPRHVFLTGNAGDGKTFAIECARVANEAAFRSFEIIRDASEICEEGKDPVRSLADQMAAALRKDRRLLVAINRGQFERLYSQVEEDQRPEDQALASLLELAKPQLALREELGDEDTSQALVVDLGLVDTLSEETCAPLLDRLAETLPSPGMDATALAALTAAKASLKDSYSRAEVLRALGALRGRGLHVTMRQLWTLGAFLVTGWRAPNTSSSLTLRDAVVARLYADESSSPISSELRSSVDPALRPHPELALSALTSTLATELRRHEALAPLLDEDASAQGLEALRVGSAYGLGSQDGQGASVVAFRQASARLQKSDPGWLGDKEIAKGILQGVFKLLHLPELGQSFPSWQHLCYNYQRSDEATRLAERAFNYQSFEVSVPRPTSAAVLAMGTWSPPRISIAPRVKGEIGPRLQLTPDLFNLIWAPKRGASLGRAQAEVLRRWVSQCGESAASLDEGVHLSTPAYAGITTISRDTLTGHLTISSPKDPN